MLDRLARQRRLRVLIGDQRDRLFRIAWSWCHDRDQAEDLVQETQARALAKLGDLRDEARAEVWLTRILANLFRDGLRQRRPEPLVEDALPADDIGPEQLTERSELVRRTRLGVARLKQEQRQVLTLVDLGGFSYAETAEILGIPAGTVMSRLARARSRLRELLRDKHTAGAVIPMRRKP